MEWLSAIYISETYVFDSTQHKYVHHPHPHSKDQTITEGKGKEQEETP